MKSQNPEAPRRGAPTLDTDLLEAHAEVPLAENRLLMGNRPSRVPGVEVGGLVLAGQTGHECSKGRQLGVRPWRIGPLRAPLHVDGKRHPA